MGSTSSGTGYNMPARPAVWNTERRRRLAEAIVAWHYENCGNMCNERGMPYYMMNVGHECIKPFYLRYLSAKLKPNIDAQTGYRTAGDIGLGPNAAPGDVERIWFELCLLRTDVLDEMEKRFVKNVV